MVKIGRCNPTAPKRDIIMKTLILSTLILFASTAIGADDASDAEAKIQEYFDTFNEHNIEKIVSSIYAMPLHIGSSSGHSAYVTVEDARSSLESLYGQIEKQGWKESVIRQIESCVIADGLVFAEVRYTRNKSNGDAITPGLRTNIYVVQHLEPGWRITAFYNKDVDKRISCSN